MGWDGLGPAPWALNTGVCGFSPLGNNRSPQGLHQGSGEREVRCVSPRHLWKPEGGGRLLDEGGGRLGGGAVVQE